MAESAQKWLLHELTKTEYARIIPGLATEIGLNESIVLMHISYWISICNNIKDGRFWTYQTLRGMQEKIFPYWSIETIRRTIQNLEKQGYIIIGNHNSRKGDRTQWFALEPNKCSELLSVVILPVDQNNHVSKRDSLSQNETPTQQNETTLPEITTENTTYKRDASHQSHKKSGTKQKPLPSDRKRWTWVQIETYAEQNPTIDSLSVMLNGFGKLKNLPTKYVALDCIELHEELQRNGVDFSRLDSLRLKAESGKKEFSLFKRMVFALPNWLAENRPKESKQIPDSVAQNAAAFMEGRE